MLYCKVKGISEKRERVKRRYKLRQDDFATEQVVVYQNCANCILKVCPSHTVCGNTQKKKKSCEPISLLFLSSKLCWCCTVSNIKPNLYI